MKKYYLIPLFLLLFINYGNSALSDNLVNYYSFEETSGTIAKDSVNALNGTIGASIAFVSGKVGNAFNFTGTSTSYVGFPKTQLDLLRNVSQPFSVGFWIKPYRNNVDTSHMFGKLQNSAPYNGWYFGLRLDKIIANLGDGSGHYIDLRCNTTINNNLWYYITYVYNGNKTAEGFEIWINGIRCSTYTSRITSGTIVNYNMSITNASIGLRDISSTTWYYYGIIDEWSYFNRVLTQSEIIQLNTSMSYAQIIAPTNQNVSQIIDNTTLLNKINNTNNYIVQVNSTNNYLFTTLNTTGYNVIQIMNISCLELGYNNTFMSGSNISLKFNNSITNNSCMIINPFNTSVNFTFYVINENLSIVDNTQYHYLVFNLTNLLRFNLLENYTNTTFYRSMNLNISQLGVNQNFTSNQSLYINFNTNQSIINATITYLNDSRVNLTTQFLLVTLEEYGYLSNETIEYIMILNNTNLILNDTALILNKSYEIIEMLEEINNTSYSILNNTYQILINLANGFTNLTNRIEVLFNTTFNWFTTLNTSLNNIDVNLNESTTEDISLIKKIQICWFNQYEQIEDYYTYCVDYANPFNLTEKELDENIALNLSAYWLNKSLEQEENRVFTGNDCYNLDKYKALLNVTDYFMLNAFLTASSISIDSAYCWLKLGFKTIASVKV